MDVIIGGGATGLAYAAFSGNECLIIEADQEIGGYCKTVRQDGFVWDYSGHFFHFRFPEMEEYICRYIAPDILKKCRKYTQIRYGQNYIDFPFQKNIHQLEKHEFIDCLYDLFCNEYNSYSNFREMLYCKFGRGIAEKFLIPYNEKLYACNLNRLDTDAMGRFFPYADKEDIIANFKSSGAKSYNDQFTYPSEGAFEYIKSLAHRVNPDHISCGERVISVNPLKHEVQTDRRTIQYDHLISTIPFPALLGMCGIDYDHTVYSWNKVLVFNLGFDSKGNDKKNNWVYFPDKSIIFYRVGYYDNIIAGDRMSLYVEIGFDKEETIDVDEAFRQTLVDLTRCGIITSQKLVSWHSVVMNPAYVHITKDSIADVAAKKDLLSKSDIYSIGRYGSWTYCSIEDGMVEARNLALQLKD